MGGFANHGYVIRSGENLHVGARTEGIANNALQGRTPEQVFIDGGKLVYEAPPLTYTSLAGNLGFDSVTIDTTGCNFLLCVFNAHYGSYTFNQNWYGLAITDLLGNPVSWAAPWLGGWGSGPPGPGQGWYNALPAMVDGAWSLISLPPQGWMAPAQTIWACYLPQYTGPQHTIWIPIANTAYPTLMFVGLNVSARPVLQDSASNAVEGGSVLIYPGAIKVSSSSLVFTFCSSNSPITGIQAGTPLVQTFNNFIVGGSYYCSGALGGHVGASPMAAGAPEIFQCTWELSGWPNALGICASIVSFHRK